MSEYNLSEEEKKHLLQFVGCNSISNTEQFYQIILKIANRSEWNNETLKTLNMLINDGMGYFLQSIFRDKFQHPLYEKHYGQKVYKGPAGGIKDLHSIADKLRKGELSTEDLSNHGYRISTLEEFVNNM
jgi:hypothetical protein